jgi:hypothetical protein
LGLISPDGYYYHAQLWCYSVTTPIPVIASAAAASSDLSLAHDIVRDAVLEIGIDHRRTQVMAVGWNVPKLG